MKNRLFRICLLVRPKDSHPAINKFKLGVLMLYLFCELQSEADERARKLVALLPYDLADSRSFVSHGRIQNENGPDERLRAIEQSAIDNAWALGFSMVLNIGPSEQATAQLFESLVG